MTAMRDRRHRTAAIASIFVVAAVVAVGSLRLGEPTSAARQDEIAASASPAFDAEPRVARAETAARDTTVAPWRVDVDADAIDDADADAGAPRDDAPPNLVVRVTYRGEPVFEGLRVLFVLRADWDAAPERHARRDGTFVYRHAPAGRYPVAVLRDELLLGQRDVEVVAGRTNEVMIDLQRPLPDAETIAASAATGNVCGTLIGRFDARYDALRVSVEPRHDPSVLPGIVDLRAGARRRVVDVDATGRFRAEGVRAGPARLELVLPDSKLASDAVDASIPAPVTGFPGSRVDLGDVVVPAGGTVDVAYDFIDRLPGWFRLFIEGGEARDDLIFSAEGEGAEPCGHFHGNVGRRAQAEFGPVPPGRWNVTIRRRDWSYAMPGPICVTVPPGGVARVAIDAADLYAPVPDDPADGLHRGTESDAR